MGHLEVDIREPDPEAEQYTATDLSWCVPLSGPVCCWAGGVRVRCDVVPLLGALLLTPRAAPRDGTRGPSLPSPSLSSSTLLNTAASLPSSSPPQARVNSRRARSPLICCLPPFSSSSSARALPLQSPEDAAASSGAHHGGRRARHGAVGGVRGLAEPAGDTGPARRHARRLLRPRGGGAGEPCVPGERQQPGDVPDAVHALLAVAVGDGGDQLHGHGVPARAPRRLPLRRLLHHLHHLHRQRLHRVHGAGDPDDPGADAAPDAAAVRHVSGRGGAVLAGVGGEEGDAVRGAVPDGAGRGRDQGLAALPRRRAIRRARPARPQGALHLLQLLRLLPLLRRARRRHLRRLGRGQQGLAVGLRHLHHRHPPLHPGLRRGLRALPQQGAHGEPAHHHRQGPRRRRPRRPVPPRRRRPERQQRRRHRPRAQPHGEHGYEGVLQACFRRRRLRRRRRRRRGRAVAGARVPEPRRRRAVHPLGVHGAGGGGRQDRAHGAAHLLLHHHAQRLPGAALHLLRRAGRHHGHARRRAHRAAGVAARVPGHLHHPPRPRLRPRHRPVRAPRDGHRDGHQPPPAHRHRAGALHRRHGRGRRRRGQAQERGGGQRDAGLGEAAAAHQLLLDRVPVPVPGVGGFVHAGRAARVLLQRGAGEDALAGDVAVVGVAGAGILPELRAGVHREQRDGARRAPAVAQGRQPEPLPPREVLLAHVRAQHPQLSLLPVLGYQVQVQKCRGYQRVM